MSLRVLVLNWRCPTNPRAGGAESVTYELCRRLVGLGHSVEWFGASYPGARTEEVIDGIQVVRRGKQWSVHWHAFRYYRKTLNERFDIVIDETNTVPFFTPLWTSVPSAMFIHQLAREVWWYEAPFPLSILGFVAEPLYLRLYRSRPVITVSASTKSDLLRLGFTGPITVVPNGVEPMEETTSLKEPEPTFIYVGRLAPSKRIHHLLSALSRFRSATGQGQLWIVGTGSKAYERRLADFARRLYLQDAVTFLGRLGTRDKHSRMARAHALLMSSVREGWGLAVIEANACGTPAIVYDIRGLRDAVMDGVNGFVVHSDPRSMATAMLSLAADGDLQGRLAKSSMTFSRRYSFDESIWILISALENLLQGGTKLDAPMDSSALKA